MSIYRFDGFGQHQEKTIAAGDSINLKKGALTARADSLIAIQKDTTAHPPPPTSLPSAAKTRDDSTKRKSEKSWIRKKIREAIFVSSSKPQVDSAEFVKSENFFLPYAGRVIGSVRLKKIGVLAGSVDDTLWTVESGISRVLNNLSMSTKDRVIFDNLTF
ncbi:MAG: hypothetical protein ONA90_04505, partial [candidate division KSB1 bacterium]|nr:hypothetical protein [candidate division KSB1 bacterium]